MTAVRRLRVFLASPGDVPREREIVREVLTRLPYDPLVDWRLVFEVVAWDQPGTGLPLQAAVTPQAAVAAGLLKPSECDFVVVILWDRMGTPLPADEYRKPDGSPYASGTEWEYLEALRASRASGRPTVLVYRRTGLPAIPPTASDHDERLVQRQRVDEFLASFRNPDGSLRGGLNDYRDPSHFGEQFEAHMRRLVAEVLASRDSQVPAPQVLTSQRAGEERLTAISTATGFVGPTDRGPMSPQLLTSWEEFERTFGPPLAAERSFLGPALRGYFGNGGGRAFVVRVLGRGATVATVDCRTKEPGPGLVFEALSAGCWGNRLAVRLEPGTRQGLRITVLDLVVDQAAADSGGRVLDDYDNVGLDPAGQNPIDRIVNFGPRASAAVRCTRLPPSFMVPKTGQLYRLAGGSDGSDLDASDYCGSATGPGAPTGLAVLASVDEAALLCVPDQAHPRLPSDARVRITAQVVAQCEHQQDRLAILGALGEPSTVRAPCDSSFAAVFYPHVIVARQDGPGGVAVSPVGHVAGALARSDQERGLHRSPNGEPIHGLLGQEAQGPLSVPVNPELADHLLRHGISPLVAGEFDGTARLFTPLTTSIDESRRSIPQRRLLSYVQTSIRRGTVWATFEVQDAALRAKLREQISAFLTSLWTDGVLSGQQADAAFFVKCDDETTTQDDVNIGRVVIEVGLALMEPPTTHIFTLVISDVMPSVTS